MSDKVTIIVPLFNRAQIVGETIDSVVSQSHSNWELLIVDDGSNDNGLDVVQQRSKNDERILGWKRESKTKGAPACRNEGLSRATGDWVIFLDSDDLLHVDCLKNRLSEAKANPGNDFYVFATGYFRNQIGDLEQIWLRPAEDQIEAFLLKPSWSVMSSFWSISAIRKIDGFRLDLISWQDWDLHIRALLEGLTYKICDGPPDNFCRRSRRSRISMVAERKLEHLANRQQLYIDTFLLMKNKDALTEGRHKNIKDQSIKLASKMMLTGQNELAESWFRQLIDCGMVEESELDDVRRQAKDGSKLTFRQQISEWKLKLVSWLAGS